MSDYVTTLKAKAAPNADLHSLATLLGQGKETRPFLAVPRESSRLAVSSTSASGSAPTRLFLGRESSGLTSSHLCGRIPGADWTPDLYLS